jgi:hypothetical protein
MAHPRNLPDLPARFVGGRSIGLIGEINVEFFEDPLASPLLED